MGRELLTHVISSAAGHLNVQLRILALTITMARFYINTSTEQAEKLGLMAYIPAQKSRDQLWQLVNGNLLAGPSPSHFPFIGQKVDFFRGLYETG